MGCNCKKKIVNDDITGELTEKRNGRNILIKILLFLVTIAMSFILYPVIVVVIFKHYFTSGNDALDLLSIIKKIKDKNIKKVEIDDQEPINNEDYELIGVEVVK
jgi:hypothetical protein